MTVGVMSVIVLELWNMNKHGRQLVQIYFFDAKFMIVYLL